VAFGSDAVTRSIGWWSPDGTMGRAVGVPAPDQAPAIRRRPTTASRRWRAVAVAGGGALLSLVVAGAIASIDGAAHPAHRNAVQPASTSPGSPP
jgi:hypothetical protein